MQTNALLANVVSVLSYIDKSDICSRIGSLAHNSMVHEVMVTPKPGLVDQTNSGSHKDMDLALFLKSADVISPWLLQMIRKGFSTADQPLDSLFPSVRPLGIACEQSMMTATRGVNTHKGMIFSQALVCSAAGRLTAQGGQAALTADRVCEMVADMTKGIVERELKPVNMPETAGEILYCRYGMTGIRGEVESGFQTICRFGLPVLSDLLPNVSLESALLQTLLHLMANSDDTNIVSRGGVLALKYVRRYSVSLLSQGGVLTKGGMERMRLFDRDMIARNLSPGGSADLLAITWLLYSLNQMSVE